MRYITREESQNLDRTTIEKIGIPGIVLMENAGAQAAYKVMQENPHRLPTLILCGKGNNGGDGAVIARYLWNHSYPFHLVLFAKPETLKGEALEQWNILQQLPLKKYLQILNPQNWTKSKTKWESYPIIVDALFGTGLGSDLREPYPNLIQWINQTSSFKVAIDLPSGLCANTGKQLPLALKANLTYTFIAPKVGFFQNDGPASVGRIQVINIGIPRHLFSESN